jgi:prolipoprotein diacylglyceryltransferase
VVVAAAVGGAVGSRLLAALEQPSQIAAHWRDLLLLSGGKTIVGGLIGGLIAVELTKRRIGVTERTGDLFALPLAVGIAIGRIGCFLSGLDDGTFGTPTALWTAIDFGDGIPRHPTQLYEIAFLLVLAGCIAKLEVDERTTKVLRQNPERHPTEARRDVQTGDRFRLFMIGYMAFRLLVDAIKPDPRLAWGLSSIQWACAAMLLYYLPDIRRWLTPRRPLLASPYDPPGNRSAC